MNPQLYALTHRGNPGDIAFYRDACRGARRVLELGSGSGRLLCALATAKHELVGLECEPALIALAKKNLRTLPSAKQRSVRIVRGDMRRFELAQRFERVLLPYNALYCLLNQRAALACFRAVRRVLAPAGRLVLDVWNAEPFQRSLATTNDVDDDPELVVSFRHAGRSWDVFEQSRVHRKGQRLDVTYSYVPRAGGALHQISIAQRYFLPEELARLLERAGFVVEARYGDFDRRRFSARSPQLIVVASAAR